VTEKRTREEIDTLVEALDEADRPVDDGTNTLSGGEPVGLRTLKWSRSRFRETRSSPSMQRRQRSYGQGEQVRGPASGEERPAGYKRLSAGTANAIDFMGRGLSYARFP